MKELPYYEQIDRKNIQKLRIMIQKLSLFLSVCLCMYFYIDIYLGHLSLILDHPLST